MPYDEKLAARIRKRFAGLKKVEEKKMIGGLTFMLNGKMCVGVIKNELLVRIDPSMHDEVIKRPGARTMDFTKRPMSGFVQVSPDGLGSEKTLDAWIELALAYNPIARSSKKKKRR